MLWYGLGISLGSRLTKQCMNHFKITVEEVIEDTENDASECFFSTSTSASCAGEVVRYTWMGIVETLGCWSGKNIVCNGDLLKRQSRLGIVREFTEGQFVRSWEQDYPQYIS